MQAHIAVCSVAYYFKIKRDFVCVSAILDHCMQLCCFENLTYLIQYKQGVEYVKLFLTWILLSVVLRAEHHNEWEAVS